MNEVQISGSLTTRTQDFSTATRWPSTKKVDATEFAQMSGQVNTTSFIWPCTRADTRAYIVRTGGNRLHQSLRA